MIQEERKKKKTDAGKGDELSPSFWVQMTSLPNLDQNFHLYDCVYPLSTLKKHFKKYIYIFFESEKVYMCRCIYYYLKKKLIVILSTIS